MNIEIQDELLSYLHNSGHIINDEVPRLQTLAGGVSNRTVLVTWANGEAWVLKQALSKLRVTTDWFSSPERVHREALGLHWINRIVPQSTPALLFEDHQQHLIAMAAVPQPHTNWKDALLAGDLQLDHIDQFAQLLATLHLQSHAQQSTFAPIFADKSFFESLRLEPYYGFTGEQAPWAASFLQILIQQTCTRTFTLVHGDYSPKNVLVHKGKLILLDHEVIHFGDPAFDVGFSLTHLLSKANHNLETSPELSTQFEAAAQRYWYGYKQNIQQDISGGRKRDEITVDLYGQAQIGSFTVRHTLACLLARIDGRSPLEYLDNATRTRQRNAIRVLIADQPANVEELIMRFMQLCRNTERYISSVELK